MLIKLKESASWGGETRPAGYVGEVDGRIAAKLIARGLAEEHVEEAEQSDDPVRE